MIAECPSCARVGPRQCSWEDCPLAAFPPPPDPPSVPFTRIERTRIAITAAIVLTMVGIAYWPVVVRVFGR